MLETRTRGKLRYLLRQVLLRLSKSQSPITVLFRTTLTGRSLYTTYYTDTPGFKPFTRLQDKINMFYNITKGKNNKICIHGNAGVYPYQGCSLKKKTLRPVLIDANDYSFTRCWWFIWFSNWPSKIHHLLHPRIHIAERK